MKTLQSPTTLRTWFDHSIAGRIRFHRALTAHRAGRRAGHFSPMSTQAPERPSTKPLLIHFWTPFSWGSTVVHVDRMLPSLRQQAGALGLQWRITNGPDLPREPVDWLLCLKAVPPDQSASRTRTVLLLNDAADRLWSQLGHFDHIVVVSSPILASLVASVHPRVWFVEETETRDDIARGVHALSHLAPSKRAPNLLWHGEWESLDGLYPLRGALEAFSRETGATLWIVTNRSQGTEQWGPLRVHYLLWSPETLAIASAQARLGIVPARPTLADSYLKSAGRVRRLYALGCPAIGDARSPDVLAFSEACGAPSASMPAQWLSALSQIWNDRTRLDAVARRGHAVVKDKYCAERTAAQWLWFFSTVGQETP
jgi:hypothetical protein